MFQNDGLTLFVLDKKILAELRIISNGLEGLK